MREGTKHEDGKETIWRLVQQVNPTTLEGCFNTRWFATKKEVELHLISNQKMIDEYNELEPAGRQQEVVTVSITQFISLQEDD